MSPNSVIEQTFNFLNTLNQISSLRLYDTEIHGHLYRQLRVEGKVDNWFEGLEDIDEKARIENLCYIPIEPDSFKNNELGIEKRRVILSNDKGDIIESGSATFDLIEKKGLFHRVFGWILKEL